MRCFGNCRRIARRILLEERFQVGIGRIDLLAQIVGRDHRVVELDLDVVLAIEVAHFLVADGHAGGDQRLQAPHGDVVLHAVFKVRDRNVEAALNQRGILVLPDELAVGKQHLARRPGLQILANVGIGDVDAQLLRLIQQDLLLDKLLADLRLDHVHDHRIAGVLRILLLHPLGGQLRNLLLADDLARRRRSGCTSADRRRQTCRRWTRFGP